MTIDVTWFAAVSVLSAAALAFEILLVRLFSIAQWHHFAYMIISVALLGYGASGTFLSFAAKRLRTRPRLAFTTCSALFAFSALAGAAVALAIPLNVLEIAWSFRQQIHLVLICLVLVVPFFLAATGVGLALAMAGDRVGLIYRSDLVGAGLGSLAAVGGLFVWSAAECVRVIGGLGLIAAALGGCRDCGSRAVPAVLFVAAAVLPWVWPDGWETPKPSPYKELSLALTVPDAEVVAERSSPLGQLTVVRSPTVPFRYAPGLGLTATAEPPEQLAVFTDGGAMTAITRFNGDFETVRYLDNQTAALPFHLRNGPRVLILGAGGGADVLLALLRDARSVDAVELNSQMIRLVQNDFADFAGNLYASPRVHLHVADARSFAANSTALFDIVHMSLLDSFSAAAAGLHALNESALYTVEAFETYLDRLAPDGFLAVTQWLKVPPQDGLKALATAIAALSRRGVTEPRTRLALVRSWRTTTLLVKNGAFRPDEIAAIRAFCAERAFDIDYYPGIQATEANRYNILDRPYLFDGAAALLGPDRQRFFDDYKFDVRPSTDDRPYFFHFLKLRTLVEMLRLPGGLNLIEWAYPVLLATLLQAVAGSVILILLPLFSLNRFRDKQDDESTHIRPKLRIVVYFSFLGLAFLFLEMAFIQRFQLFLGHPLYAVSVVISGFLVFAGVGSGSARWMAARLRSGWGFTARIAAGAIALLALTYLKALPTAFDAFAASSLPVRIVAAIALIAPLAFFMGMPFPLGLAAVSARAPALVPWAWGINGCASVVSAVAATLLAIHLGFSWVIVSATVLYGVATMIFPGEELGLFLRRRGS